MLNLASATDPEWTRRALASLDEVLLDHAHCEKKAAGIALRLIFRYPRHAFLVAPLSRLAREELEHFEKVLRALDARGVEYRPQRAAPYAGLLRQGVRGKEPDRLVDTLLCNALIEARSCERFQLLYEAVEDRELADLYRGLLEAEARHHRVYLNLAEQIDRRAAVHQRLRSLAQLEARVLADGPRLPRMHG